MYLKSKRETSVFAAYPLWLRFVGVVLGAGRQLQTPAGVNYIAPVVSGVVVAGCSVVVVVVAVVASPLLRAASFMRERATDTATACLSLVSQLAPRSAASLTTISSRSESTQRFLPSLSTCPSAGAQSTAGRIWRGRCVHLTGAGAGAPTVTAA